MTPAKIAAISPMLVMNNDLAYWIKISIAISTRVCSRDRFVARTKDKPALEGVDQEIAAFHAVGARFIAPLVPVHGA